MIIFLKTKGFYSQVTIGKFATHSVIMLLNGHDLFSQGRNMVYGLRAHSPKYDWDQGSEERAQGSEEWDQGSQGFWAQIRDQIYYTV